MPSSTTLDESVLTSTRERLRDMWDIIPHPQHPGQWAIFTPFTYRDGDGMSVVLAKDDEGWKLTDNGFTVFHCFVDEFDGFFFRGFDRIQAVLDYGCLEVGEGSELFLRLDDDEAPDTQGFVFAVASFLMGLERLRGAALVHKEGHHGSCGCCTVNKEWPPTM